MAELKRPTKRERGEAINILKNEERRLYAAATGPYSDYNDYHRKLAAQHLRKAERLAKVIAWIEGIANAR